MNKLLVMGANPETVSLVLKAKEMGFYTIVTDYDPHAYAKQFADQAENVNAVDVEGLVELAKREDVSGVIVGVAEALLPTYCEVCKRLNLPCYSTPDKFEMMVRKDLFKQKCREYNVPTIKEYSSSDFESIVFPVIVKPVDSCSSKGIRICNNYEDLNRAISYALEFSKSKKYLIEEYLVGDEVISYYVIQDGNPIFVGMCDRYTYKGSNDLVQLPTAYIFPSRHINAYMNYTDSAIKEMIKGIGLENGSIFFQCFVDKDGIVRTYEPGYRLNGAQEHIVISKVSGIDAKEMYINFAFKGKVADSNLEPLANPQPNKLLCKLSPLVKPGIISKLEGLEAISELADVVSVNPSYRQGDNVVGEGTLKQIVSRFFIVSNTKADMIKTINNIYDLLVVENETGENMIIGKFEPDSLMYLY
jgi:biotin carboxylase